MFTVPDEMDLFLLHYRNPSVPLCSPHNIGFESTDNVTLYRLSINSRTIGTRRVSVSTNHMITESYDQC